MSIARPQRVPEQDKIWNFSEPQENRMQKIIAFSGKIGAGKTSHSNFIHSLAFVHLLQQTPFAEVNQEGKLVVQDRDNQRIIVDPNARTPEAIRWFLENNVWVFIRTFSFAEPLKKLCMQMFDLPYESVYGTQAQKATPTLLRWEDMPTKTGKTGFMSGRDVLEYVGTEIFRKMYPDCHANATGKSIITPDPYYGLSAICISDDVRFPNEVAVIKSLGGIVVRLTKVTEEGAKNKHDSNTALDDFDGFDYVIDNQNITMDESFGQLLEILYQENWFQAVNS